MTHDIRIEKYTFLNQKIILSQRLLFQIIKPVEKKYHKTVSMIKQVNCIQNDQFWFSKQKGGKYFTWKS